MDNVTVKGLRFKAFHGCHAEERLTGGVFETDVTVYVDNDNAALTDMIDDAVDYVVIMDLIKEVMEKPRNLIETVAKDICQGILDRFPTCTETEVTVKKLSPPVHHELDFVSVTTSLKRG